MLKLIKAWLEMPVEEDDGEGGRRRRNRGRKQRKGTPQGAPISPLLSNLYMRRFILGWKVLGYAQRFCAEIVNYADDFCVLGKAAAAEMLEAVKRIMEELKLPVNERKTRCLRCPEEALEFLGYRIGRNYRPKGRESYIGTRPSQASVGSICRRISEWTAPRNGVVLPGQMVEHLNRVMTGWANYYGLGQVSPAYRAIERGPAAASVALSEAQGEVRGDSALHGQAAAGLRSHLPGVEDEKLSVGEGMIPTESRMLENRRPV